MQVDARVRTVVKTVSWRLISILITFIIALIVTGSKEFAISISVLDMLVKLLGYYCHERIWTNIPWGKG